MCVVFTHLGGSRVREELRNIPIVYTFVVGMPPISQEHQIQPPAHHIDTQVTGMVAGSSGGGGANWEQLEPRIAFAVTDVIFIFSVILYTWVR